MPIPTRSLEAFTNNVVVSTTRLPDVVIFWLPKSGEIFEPAIAALAFISAFTIVPSAILADVTTPLSIVKVSPPLATVISPLSPSSIPPPPDISATEPLSFFVKILPESVRMANSPTTKSLALGSLPLPL